MRDPFKSAAETFDELKKRFQAGDLSRQQFIDEMKKLRLKDAQGRYWMIGAQTGKWYFFDGRDWVVSDPPISRDKGPVCFFCGHENKEGAGTCGRCGGSLEGPAEGAPDRCPDCGGPLEKPLMICPRCEPRGSEAKTVEIIPLDESLPVRDGVYIVRSLNSASLFRFMGALGGLAGAAYGVFAGATGSLPAAAASRLPEAIAGQQGKLLGALIDGLAGAAAGVLGLGLAGIVLACLVNLLLAAGGGIKLKLSAPGAASPKASSTGDGKGGSAPDRDGLGFNLLGD
jgi:hypothetical protein